jgi:hypothetical protein
VAPTEFDAVREALAWAEPGDLLVLPTHTERARVGDLLARLEVLGWRPGDRLPD